MVISGGAILSYELGVGELRLESIMVHSVIIMSKINTDSGFFRG